MPYDDFSTKKWDELCKRMKSLSLRKINNAKGSALIQL